ncbi:MAG: GNAT family N-acetyltransferase [Pseudomonadota bacterium]
MSLAYAVDRSVTVDQFVDLLRRSTLAERRPVDDRDCIAGMLAHADLTVSAWEGETLVGISRSVTDFHYACYLSDLAVAESHQRQGIGQALIRETEKQLQPGCQVILLAAPDAHGYYCPLGFEAHPRCWIKPRA